MCTVVRPKCKRGGTLKHQTRFANGEQLALLVQLAGYLATLTTSTTNLLACRNGMAGMPRARFCLKPTRLGWAALVSTEYTCACVLPRDLGRVGKQEGKGD